MSTPLKNALAIAVGTTFVSFIVCCFLAMWGLLSFSSWGQVWGLSFFIALIVGLLVWINGRLRALNDQIVELSYELDQLKKRR